MLTPKSVRPRVRRLLPLVALIGIAALVGGCRLIGTGQLFVMNDPAGGAPDDTFVRAYAHEPGNPFPPEGYIGFHLIGSHIGDSPRYNLTGSVYFVTSRFSFCPVDEPDPRTFHFRDDVVDIIETVPVKDGRINHFFIRPGPLGVGYVGRLMWGLVDVKELPGSGGEHLIRRCGNITWTE